MTVEYDGLIEGQETFYLVAEYSGSTGKVQLLLDPQDGVDFSGMTSDELQTEIERHFTAEQIAQFEAERDAIFQVHSDDKEKADNELQDYKDRALRDELEEGEQEPRAGKLPRTFFVIPQDREPEKIKRQTELQQALDTIEALKQRVEALEGN